MKSHIDGGIAPLILILSIGCKRLTSRAARKEHGTLWSPDPLWKILL